jgi:acetoin:2,6-dichlorophenolindophenol oxidoreductase subunit alpha
VRVSPDEKRRMLETMLLIRRFEEKVKVLYKEGVVIGAIHLYIGQEAVAAGVCSCLRADDWVYSTHRGHGHAIAKGCDLAGIMAELMGRDTGLSRGHGGSMHLFDPPHGLMGGNGIVGGGIPLALGAAFSAQYRSTDQVSVAFFSDGAANQGTFSESLNLAALFRLPVLFACENNCYAATTPVAASTARIDIAGRALAYGVQGARVDGNDCVAVAEAARQAVADIRGGGGPRLLECSTYRIEPHCGIIPDERENGEREAWVGKDPLQLLRSSMEADGSLPAGAFAALEEGVAARIEAAVRFGRESPWPDPAAVHNARWAV